MKNKKFTKHLYISLGDPAGISPYIFSKLNWKKIPSDCKVIFWGDKQALDKYKSVSAFEITEIPIDEFYKSFSGNNELQLEDTIEDSVNFIKEKSRTVLEQDNQFQLISLAKPDDFVYGKPNILSGLFSYLYFRMCLEALNEKSESRRALLTAPLSKEWVGRCVGDFRGHTTEMEDFFGRKLVMLLSTKPGKESGKKMSVIPMTTHIPLREVAEAVKNFDYRTFGKTLSENKKLLQISNSSPVALLSVNPHAGEGGLIGDEEEILKRWTEEWEKAGLPVHGVFPADGFFGSGDWKKYSVILGTYHDQVLTPFKFYAAQSGVNISLNLPFFRISPDHGPAYNLSSIKEASSESLELSFQIALEYLEAESL